MRGAYWTRAAVVLAMAGLAMALGRAEVSGQEPLTLDRALEIAHARNPEYRQASNSVELNVSESRSLWFEEILPRANLTLFNTGFNGNLQRRAFDNFGNPIERPEAEWQYFSNTRQALSLGWSIQGSSLFQAYQAQKLTNRGRDAALGQALTELEVTVRRLYMDALEQRELMEAEEELVDARRVDLDVAQRLFSLAMRTRVDVLNAELAIEQQSLVLQQQRAAFAQAKLALIQALGDDELEDVVLADEPLDIFDPSGLDADALVSTAREVNPEIRGARLAVDQAQVDLKRNQNSWWPSLEMSMTVVRNSQTRQGDPALGSLFDFSLGDPLDSYFSVGLSFPMFNNYFSNRRSMHQATVDLDNRQEAEREVRLRVESTVRGAVLELQNQRESLRLSERSAAIAQEALRLAREEYRLATRSFEDLRAAFEQEADTRRQVISARHSFVDALLSLEEAVGTRIGPAGPVAGGR